MKSPLKATCIDYVTLSEVVKVESASNLQSNLIIIRAWSEANKINLIQEGKEMLVCPLQHEGDVAPLIVNSVRLEKVSSHKLRDLTVMNNFKWNNNINEIIFRELRSKYMRKQVHGMTSSLPCFGSPFNTRILLVRKLNAHRYYKNGCPMKPRDISEE